MKIRSGLKMVDGAAVGKIVAADVVWLGGGEGLGLGIAAVMPCREESRTTTRAKDDYDGEG